jgi:drug/metabolite transporter (DMT)-like permease
LKISSSSRLAGVVLIVISAASYGTLGIFAQLAYGDGLDVPTLLFLRFGIATAIMCVLLLLWRQPLPFGKTLGGLIGMGAVVYVGQSYCYLSAVKYASPGLAALLLYLYPAFVFILSALFLREKITLLKGCALALALLGAALTANPQGGSWAGVLLAISAAVIYAVYIIVGTGVMKGVPAAPSSAVILASAAVVYGVFAAVSGPHWPTTRAGWLAVMGIAVVSTVIPVGTFLAGLKRVGPTDASMLSTLEPVVTVVLAAQVLGERLRPLSLVGGALILAAVLLLAQSELRRARAEAASG